MVALAISVNEATKAATATIRMSDTLRLCGVGRTRCAGSEYGGADAERQWPRRFDLADQRHQDQEMDEIIRRRDLADRDDWALRQLAADIAEYDRINHQDPGDDAVDRPEPGAAHRRGVEPGDEKEDQHRAEHQHDADQFAGDAEHVEGDRPQDRV